MPLTDPALRRRRDRERARRRTAKRIALGLCPSCGNSPPAPGRAVCETCADKRRAADRARAAKRRKAGIKRIRHPEARKAEFRRARERADQRVARGLCARCGRNPHETDRRLCGDCAQRRRAAERARYRKAKLAGRKYGGKSVSARRSQGRRRSRQRRQIRRDASLCVRCGRQSPVDGGASCEQCLATRRAADQATYRTRREAGLCVRCGITTFQGEALCGPCAVVDARRQPGRNAAARQRYDERKARQLCTHCGKAPSFGASRCEPCASKAYARSEHVRGLPVYGAEFTVVHAATREQLGVFGYWEDVVLCLSFARLSFDEVEVLHEHAPMQPVLTGFS